jgi:hypothetical protein
VFSARHLTKKGGHKREMGKQRTIVFVFFHITAFAGKKLPKSIKNGETIRQDIGFYIGRKRILF